MLKRIIQIVLLLAIIPLSTGAGCSPTANQSQNLPKVTLTMWGLFDDPEVFQPIIKRYEELNPNITVNYIKKDYNEYELLTSEALAAGEGPDIWLIRNDWMPRHYKKLVPMNDNLFINRTGKNSVESFKNTFAPIAVNDNIINNKIYGIPLSIDTLAIYYNTDIFRKKANDFYNQQKQTEGTLFENPPATWDNFISQIKLLTEKNGSNITKSAASIGTANNIDQAIDLLSVLMLQNNTAMVSADKNSATFNLSINKSTGEPYYPGTKALDFYTSFSNPVSDNYTWNNNMENTVQAFEDGKVAMMFNYSYIQKRLLQEKPTLNYSIAPLPQVTGVNDFIDYTTYWTETVTKNSKNPIAAWNLILYLTTQSNSDYTIATKRPDPYIINTSDLPHNINERGQLKGDNVFRIQKMTAKTWYRTTRPDKVDNLFLDMINNVVVNKQGSQAAIDAAAAKVTDLLKLNPNGIPN